MAGVQNLTSLFPPSVKRAGDQMTGALDLAPAVTVASAATTPIGAAASNFVVISGTTAITAFDSVAESVDRKVRFASAGVVLTYNATSLILPGFANITTQAGDHAEFRSLGSGNWRCISYQRADGTALVVAAVASFPVTGVVAKSAAYPIVAADKGTMFDLTGSFALTLPAASGGSASAPLYYHFRKRDGSGRCTVAPAGTDTIEGSNTAIALYQERATLVSFGAGWVFPPGGREKVVDVVLPTAFSAASAIAMLSGFDADVKDVEIEFYGTTTSADLVGLTMQFYRGAAYVTSSYSYGGLDFNGSSSPTATVTSSTNDSALYLGGASARTSNSPISATVTVRNAQATGGKGPTVESRGTAIITGAAGGSWTSRGFQGNQNPGAAIAGLKIYGLGGGTTITGVYSQRITRQ